MVGLPGALKEGWLLVSKDGFYGFIDETGAEIVKPEYEAIEPIVQTL